MKYERLTKRDGKYRVSDFTPKYLYGEKSYIFGSRGMHDIVERLNRLAELEDEIEQGTLKEIPENAVVLTEEEKRKFLHGMYEQGKFDGVVKFAERLKQVGELHYYFGEQRYDIATDDIDEICKEITEGKV